MASAVAMRNLRNVASLISKLLENIWVERGIEAAVSCLLHNALFDGMFNRWRSSDENNIN